jgi:hypothetical protein
MKTLHPALTLSLSALESGLVPGATWYSAFLQSLSLAKLWTAPNISKSLKAA